MAERDSGWRADLERWLEPFLARLFHPARRAMCPLCIAGLIGPGDRKSVQPMARRLGLVLQLRFGGGFLSGGEAASSQRRLPGWRSRASMYWRGRMVWRD